MSQGGARSEMRRKSEKRQFKFSVSFVAMTEPEPTLPNDKAIAPVVKISWGSYMTQHPVTAWTNQQVSVWLIEIELGHLVPLFSRFNGRALLSLTDRLIDEVLSTSNPSVKELGEAYQVADKVNFKLHFETLRDNVPVVYRCYRYLEMIVVNLGPKVQGEMVSKISSKAVETILKWVALGSAAMVTGYVATSWGSRKKSKKEL